MGRGRPSLPKRELKIPFSISVRPEILKKIDELRNDSGRTRTEFVESFLERYLYDDRCYVRYMLMQKEAEVSYWRNLLNKAELKVEIKKSKEVELWD